MAALTDVDDAVGYADIAFYSVRVADHAGSAICRNRCGAAFSPSTISQTPFQYSKIPAARKIVLATGKRAVVI